MVARSKVLIVEDENIVQLHLRVTVQELGYDVCGVAATADEAMLCAAENTPHLVLMDIGLPGDRDGIDLAQALQELYDIAVVFLTAYADEETIGRAQEVAPLGYVVKPFSKPQLRAALTTAAAEHRSPRHGRDRESSWSSSRMEASEALIVTDLHGMVHVMNSQAVALTGWTEEEAFDRHVLDVLRTGEVSEGESRMSSLEAVLPLQHGGLIGGMNFRNREGSRRTIEGEVRPFLGAGGVRRGTVIAFREVRSSGGRTVDVVSAAPRPFGERTRMAIFSHDTLGLGHLRRCLNISRGLTGRFPELSILLLTGSPAVNRFSIPTGVDYIKLPSVQKVGTERYQSRSLSMSDSEVLDLRRNLVLRSIQGFDPHVLLVDHSPEGMGGEMLPALQWLRENRPQCINVLGMRDIVDDASIVTARWTNKGTYEVLRRLYDHVLVYGSPEVNDVESVYRFPSDLHGKTRYCHYVQDDGGGELDPAARSLFDQGRPVVVVTIGGGDGGGELVLGTYLSMLQRFESSIDFESIILPGPFLPPGLRERFREACTELPATLLDFVPSTSPFMKRADLVICTAGYNTMAQVLGNGRRALVIPRIMHRKEQITRARRFAELDLVTLLHPRDVTVERLRAEVTSVLADPAAPLEEARARSLIPLNGTERIADFFGDLLISDPEGRATPST